MVDKVFHTIELYTSKWVNGIFMLSVFYYFFFREEEGITQKLDHQEVGSQDLLSPPTTAVTNRVTSPSFRRYWNTPTPTVFS